MIDVICLGSLYGLIDSQIDSTSSVQRRNLIDTYTTTSGMIEHASTVLAKKIIYESCS
jgi:hypothetical protein